MFKLIEKNKYVSGSNHFSSHLKYLIQTPETDADYEEPGDEEVLKENLRLVLVLEVVSTVSMEKGDIYILE